MLLSTIHQHTILFAKIRSWPNIASPGLVPYLQLWGAHIALSTVPVHNALIAEIPPWPDTLKIEPAVIDSSDSQRNHFRFLVAWAVFPEVAGPVMLL